MAEDMDVGIDRLQEDIEERRKEAIEEKHTEGGRPRWLDYLAISTALFAVFAAAAALEAGNYANEALFKANQGVLKQTQAVDAWSEFQADSIKKQTQQNLVILLAHVGGTPAEIKAANDEAARRQGQQDALMKEAKARDAETAALTEESESRLEHHHRFAVSVTLFQVAIGLAAIAALLRRPAVWYGSLGAGALALLAFIDGFSLTF
ncbi:MAG: DUF4337 domain-containing protein [Thermomicrobia bacterium]|nr:DUF4337 domain-containing protein [Thermomicrobia bacterium]